MAISLYHALNEGKLGQKELAPACTAFGPRRRNEPERLQYTLCPLRRTGNLIPGPAALSASLAAFFRQKAGTASHCHVQTYEAYANTRILVGASAGRSTPGADFFDKSDDIPFSYRLLGRIVLIAFAQYLGEDNKKNTSFMIEKYYTLHFVTTTA